jgi:hypothetical protein
MASAAAATLKTEDTGKIFERALCFLFNIPYDGKYKYSEEAARALLPRLEPLGAILRKQMPSPRHSAKAGGRYDFTDSVLEERCLSAKTTKGADKVCPQVIGQPTKKRFCEAFGLPAASTNDDIKTYIEANIPQMLVKYEEYTFDCPTLYYNAGKDKLLLITRKTPIDWSLYSLALSRSHTKGEWNESSTLQLELEDGKFKAIGEFQVHNHRSAIKFRWNLEALLALFPDNFTIVSA